VTWHPQLQQLVHSPLEEQNSLRGPLLASLTGRALSANELVPLGLPQHAGNQSEIRVSFTRPTTAVRLSVRVMVDAVSGHAGTEMFIEYAPPPTATQNATSQVQVGSGGTTDVLNLLPGDKTLDLVLYVDNTFTEVYWMGGRVAMTIVTPSSSGQDDASISANQSGVTVSVTAWAVGSIWVAPEQVKSTPRRDVA